MGCMATWHGLHGQVVRGGLLSDLRQGFMHAHSPSPKGASIFIDNIHLKMAMRLCAQRALGSSARARALRVNKPFGTGEQQRIVAINCELCT